MRSPAEAREGVELRSGLFGRERVGFDEVESVDGGQAVLVDGRRLKLPADEAERVALALAPPEVSGDPVRDLEALGAWMAGPWSPVRAGRSLLELGARSGASDVHLEPGPEGYAVRLRLARELEGLGNLEAEVGTRLVAALKHLSGCLPYRSDVVQEGRIAREGVAADVRASFLPTALGERVALRLFGRLRTLDELGLPVDVAALLAHRSGLVVVAGPSGGGKTTTLYAALAHVATSRGGAHVSIEDPVEQRLRVAGIPVDQVELVPERGLTAEKVLAGVLRQDVDVVALGEFRTPGEARLALEAAHTGRLVLAGLHAGDCADARQRLLDLGVEPGVLDSTLRGVLHQELRTVSCCVGGCPRCAGVGRVVRAEATLWVA